VDLVVLEAVSAIGDRDWGRLNPLLHPCLHWTRPDGEVIRGRARLVRQLEGWPPPGAPACCELRGGQIYWWVQ
jgi:hypothetical protein